jgi:hypothetical protein
MKVGDTVRLIGIPADVKDDGELQTRSLFEKCWGKRFSIVAVETVEGLPYPVVRLDVGCVAGQPAHSDTIWVEPQYLRLEQRGLPDPENPSA